MDVEIAKLIMTSPETFSNGCGMVLRGRDAPCCTTRLVVSRCRGRSQALVAESEMVGLCGWAVPIGAFFLRMVRAPTSREKVRPFRGPCN